MAKRDKQSKVSAMVDSDHRDIIEEAKANLAYFEVVFKDQADASKADLSFCQPGGHWPDTIRAEREADGRPCLEVDMLSPFINQIVNEQRQARPQPSVNPTGNGASRETAEILQGMIRHIAYMSDGDVAIDTAFESTVRCGLGYFRVLTDYKSPESFEQNINIERITDIFSVYLDPASMRPDGSDAEWGAIATWIPKAQYKAEYPNSKMTEADDQMWNSIGEAIPGWAAENGAGCRVVEYFKRIRKPIKIVQLEDGTTVKKADAPEGAVILQERDSSEISMMWFKLNGVEVLDQTEWPGKYVPIIPIYGNELFVEGKRILSGLVRTAKDPSRFYDFWKTAQAELIALAPKAPFIMAKGSMVNPDSWRNANKRPIAALEYEAFDDRGNPLPAPHRDMAEPPIQAVTSAMMGAQQDLKAATGMFDPSRGVSESGQSGVAIRSLQRQGQVANYHYQDNAARSIRHLGRVMIDLIPKIYDTARVVRIVKPDLTEELVKINQPTKDSKGIERIYDVKTGEYDVTVSVGPGYQTKRQENLALLETMLQGPLGALMSQVAPDLVVSMLDFEISKELQERLKKTLPPQFQDEEGQGQQIPPQIQQQLQEEGKMVETLTAALHAAKDELSDKTEERLGKERIELYKIRADILKSLIGLAADEAKLGLEQELQAVNRSIEETLAPAGAESQPVAPPQAPEAVGPAPEQMGVTPVAPPDGNPDAPMLPGENMAGANPLAGGVLA